jgi:hypothetical protein
VLAGFTEALKADRRWTGSHESGSGRATLLAAAAPQSYFSARSQRQVYDDKGKSIAQANDVRFWIIIWHRAVRSP